MTIVAVLVTVLLAAGAALTLVRIVRGPTILDRIVGTDVLLAIIVVGLACQAAITQDATALPILAVLSVLGFTGSVSVARFATRRAASADDTTPHLGPVPASTSAARDGADR
jgi:multicomponent Na+:H+ antiporter subunit F